MAPIKILVTGGTGFLGSEIVNTLVAAGGFDITVLDINPPSLGTASYPEVQYVRCDLTRPKELRKIFQEVRPRVVIHTAAISPVGAARYSKKDKDAVFEVNFHGTSNVLDASGEAGVEALVYTSSVTVLMDELERDFRNAVENWDGKPTTVYGQSKVC